jgi:hypothetical protein
MNKTQSQHFWTAHRKLHDKISLFNEIQHGPNPLTEDEMRAMADKWPERYGFMLAFCQKADDE